MQPTRSGSPDATDVRRLRHELEQLLRALRVWIDLLRHKAHALRTAPPGRVEPHNLAEALAAGVPSQRTPGRPGGPRALGHDDPHQLMRQAQTLWDTVADPWDEQARHELADAADRLADRLEHRWLDAGAQLRSSTDELVRVLAGARREAGPHDR